MKITEPSTQENTIVSFNASEVYYLEDLLEFALGINDRLPPDSKELAEDMLEKLNKKYG